MKWQRAYIRNGGRVWGIKYQHKSKMMCRRGWAHVPMLSGRIEWDTDIRSNWVECGNRELNGYGNHCKTNRIRSARECKTRASQMGAIAVEFKANLACVMTFPEMDQNGDCPGGVVWYQRWKFKRDGDNRPATIRQNGNCSNKKHPWATYVAFIKYSTAEEVSVAEDIHMIEDAGMAEGVDMTKEVDVDAEVSIAPPASSSEEESKESEDEDMTADEEMTTDEDMTDDGMTAEDDMTAEEDDMTAEEDDMTAEEDD